MLYLNYRTRYNLNETGTVGKPMETLESINLITRKPGVRGGRPCILGTGLKVSDIVMAMRYHDRSPEQISEGYQISMAEVYAALSYYHAHQREIDNDIDDQIKTARKLRDEHLASGKPSLLS